MKLWLPKEESDRQARQHLFDLHLYGFDIVWSYWLAARFPHHR